MQMATPTPNMKGPIKIFSILRATISNKEMNFSDTMSGNGKKLTPIKPPKSGNGPRALPELTDLTGKKSKSNNAQRQKPKVPSSNQDGTVTPKKTNVENQLTPVSGDSLKNMNPTVGFEPAAGDERRGSWVERPENNQSWISQMDSEKAEEKLEDSSILDSSVEELEAPATSSSKRKTKRGRKGEEPQKKKARAVVTWTEVAKFNLCLITSTDLDKVLIHDDFLHIQEEVFRLLEETPDTDWELVRIAKGGLREGFLQIALESGSGVAWFAANTSAMKPRIEGEPGYQFFGPGKRPFNTFKAIVSHLTKEVEPEQFARRIKAYNRFMRDGYLSASKISSNKSLTVFQLRIGNELMDALAKENFRVCYGLSTITLQPLVGLTVAEEEEMDVA